MNTKMIERRWARLTDAMGAAARSLAVPLMGIPVGPALVMIVRPGVYSPLEMRMTAIWYLTVVTTLMTAFTVKHWRHPDPHTTPPDRQLALAEEIFTNAAALYDGAVAINETTTELLRVMRERPDPTDD